MSELPDNWTHVRGSFYIVRTQAGLRQALRHFGRMNDEEVRGHPTSYPSLISISVGYTGNTFFRVDAVHLNRLQDKIANQGKPADPPTPVPELVAYPDKMTVIRVRGDEILPYDGVSETIEPTRSALYDFFKAHDVWGLISPSQLSVHRLSTHAGPFKHKFGIWMDTEVIGYADRPLQEDAA